MRSAQRSYIVAIVAMALTMLGGARLFSAGNYRFTGSLATKTVSESWIGVRRQDLVRGHSHSERALNRSVRGYSHRSTASNAHRVLETQQSSRVSSSLGFVQVSQPRINAIQHRLASSTSLLGANSGAATGAFAVTAISTQTPVSLSPLRIGIPALNPLVNASVQFSDGAGFSVVQAPIRIDSDGTVIVATPLYFDLRTRQIGSKQLTVTVTQNGLSSTPVSVTVQPPPTAAAYGLQPGEITKAFFQYAAMRVARQLGEFQALQALPTNTVDTSEAQDNLFGLLTSIIEARSDIDRVAKDPSLNIDAGAMNGTSMQFNAKSLDMMDAAIGSTGVR